MTSELEELTALDAAGALTDGDRSRLRGLLDAATQADRDDAAALYAAAGALGAAAGRAASRTPSPALRDRLMARVRVPGSFSVMAEHLPWISTPIEGLRMKVLSHDVTRNAAVLLMSSGAGVRFPPHHHSGAEECYVIAGELHVMGSVLHAGDFHHAEADSDHGELYTPTGVDVLLVVAASDYGLQSAPA